MPLTTQALLARGCSARVQLLLGGVLPRRGAGDLEDELGRVEQDLEVDLLPEVVRVDRGLDRRVRRRRVLQREWTIVGDGWRVGQQSETRGGEGENARWTRARAGG